MRVTALPFPGVISHYFHSLRGEKTQKSGQDGERE